MYERQQSLGLIAYFLLPLVLKKTSFRNKFIDALVVLILWLPIEFAFFKQKFVAPLAGLELVLIYHYLWPIRTPWRMGLRFKIGRQEFSWAFGAVAGLALTLLPLALLLKFVAWNPHAISWITIPLVFIFALLEEILFRGVIQNLLELHLRNKTTALVFSSTLFGIAHLNNVTLFSGTPNYRYALLAAIAGGVYGYVWLRTRNFVTSSVTHASVNLLWRILFR